MHESVFAGEGLGAFKTSVNRFITRLTVLFFFLLLDYFSFIFPITGILDSMEVLSANRLYAFTHIVFGLVFLGGVLVGSHVCVFRYIESDS